MNEKIFSKVIENHLKLSSDDFKFISIKSEPATAPGDNYMSIMLRFKLEIVKSDGEKLSLSYVVKCLLSNFYYKDMVQGFNAFPKEMQMYSEIIPEFEKLFEKVGVDVRFAPKCYYTADEPTQMIIMEDLQDYKMVEKSLGFDQAHVETGLEWLAKFHAASMVYREKNKNFGDELTTGFFSESMKTFYQPYYDDYFESYIEALKEFENGEKYAEKVEKFQNQFLQKHFSQLNMNLHSHHLCIFNFHNKLFIPKSIKVILKSPRNFRT